MPGEISLEEFLKKWGRNYSLRIVNKKGIVHIIIQSLEIDGDESSQDFYVVDNRVHPIDNTYHDE